jgi:alkylation response protein AidB-like acyl-CoA dehydrogenase
MALGDDDFIDHAEALEEDAFVFIRDRGFAAFVVPEDLGGGEGNDQVIAEGAGLLEELEVAGVEDVVATGDEDFFHGCFLVMITCLGEEEAIVFYLIDEAVFLGDPA